MPHALVAGCGYVGLAAAKIFLERGWRVTGWVRSQASARRLTREITEVRAVDIADVRAVRQNSFTADVVVHCASSGGGGIESYRAVYLNGARNLVTHFPDGQMLFSSSTSVYAQSDGSWVDENSPANPLTGTGRMLREAEDAVLARNGVVLRIAGIYGPGRSFLLDSVRDGTASVIPERFVNQVHRDDVASAIVFLAREGPSASGQILNVVDNTPALRSEILKWLSSRLGVPLRDDAPGSVQTKRGRSNKRVSNATLRALSWNATYPSYVEGFERSILPAMKAAVT